MYGVKLYGEVRGVRVLPRVTLCVCVCVYGKLYGEGLNLNSLQRR